MRLFVLLPVLLAAAESPLLDLTGSLPRPDDADCTIALTIPGLGSLRAEPDAAGMVLLLQRRDGAWAAGGHRGIAQWHQKSSSACDLGALRFDGQRLHGTLIVHSWGWIPDRPADAPTPEHADRIELVLDAQRQPGQHAAWQPDPAPFMPPWRKEVPTYGGELLAGTVQATMVSRPRAAKAKRGEPPPPPPPTVAQSASFTATGAINAAPVPDRWGCEGNIVLAPADGGGITLTARLSERRVPAPHEARIVRHLSQAVDGCTHGGLRITVDSAILRADATLSLWLREADGSWYAATGAAPLIAGRSVGEVRWEMLRRAGGWDEDHAFDPRAISAIALGFAEPAGVGLVACTVRSLEWLPADPAIAQEPITVTLHDASWEMNGATQIPKGLFGMHDVDGHDLRKHADGGDAAIALAAAIRPGFLRRIDHTGFGGKAITDAEIATGLAARQGRVKPDTASFRRLEAADAVDGVLIAHSTNLWARPPWMDSSPEAFAPAMQAFYRQFAAGAWSPGDEFNPVRRAEVWNEPFMWGRHINMGAQHPAGKKAWEDPTQHGYLPAELGAEAYAVTFRAARAGARSANPHLLLGGPSAPGFPEDDYTSFFNYTARILDKLHDQLDFLTEHHYQGEADAYAASYLVATAYLDTRHGRRLPIYNTECNDLADAPTKGDNGMPPPWSLKADQLNRVRYNAEDILRCLLLTPDLAQGRSLHALWGNTLKNPGEEHCYRLLAPLRGTLLVVTSSDPRLVVAAASPRPGRVELIVFNDSSTELAVTPAVPAGLHIVYGARIVFAEGTAIEALTAAQLAAPRLGGGCLLRLGLEGSDGRPTAHHTQVSAFWQPVHHHLTPGATVTAPVLWRERFRASAHRAWVRVVTRGCDGGECTLRYAGQQLTLPWSSRNEGCAVVQDLDLDPAGIVFDAPLMISCTAGGQADGATIYAVAVYLEHVAAR